jgi:hypothetical protein
MFDAIVHLVRMSFTHGWLKPAEPVDPLPKRSTCECDANDGTGNSINDTTAQTSAPQRIWFGGCCGG